MCKAFEEAREEAAKEAAAKATREKAISVAQKLLKEGMPYEKIADMVELPVEDVKALDMKNPA